MNILNRKYFKFIIIIIFSVISYFVYYKCIYLKLIEVIDHNAFDKLNSITRNIENSLNTKLNEVKTISNINLKYKSSEINYNKILESVKDSLFFQGVFIFNTDGTPFLEENNIINMGEYKYFKDACMGKTTLSGPIYDYNSKKLGIAIASPIRNSTGEIEKILIIFFDTKELTNNLKNINFDDRTLSFITTSDKKIVAGNTDFLTNNITNTGNISETNPELIFIKSIQNKAVGTLSGKEKFTYNKEKTQAFFIPFKNNDWILASVIPEDILYREIYDLNIFIIAAILIIILIVSLTAVYSSKLTVSLINEKKKNDFIINSSNIITFKINKSGGIISYNENFKKIINLKETEIKKGSIYNIIPETYYTVFNVFYEKIINSSANNEQLDMPLIENNGKWVYILWNASSYNTKLDQVEFVGTNISALKEYEKKVQKIAYFDRLTGLNNLIYLEEYFNGIISINTTNTKIALIYINVDNFKYINDIFGHNTGDNFIIDLSNRILSVENVKAKVCKRGGDEFVVIYEYIEDSGELNDYIDKVFKAIKNEYYINNVRLNISVSIGVSLYPDDGVTYEELFKCADIALQIAKENFKGKIKYFNNSMKNDIYEIVSIENDLKNAIENNEFVLYYQPQYNIKTGKLYGFEALIRWISPKKGFVRPDKFIPQAEKNQLIIPIGKFAFRSTCDFINKLTSKGFSDLCVSVNISVVQMMCDDFVDFIINTVKEKNINPKNIKLEITESVLIKSIDDIVKKINTLNSYGIRFSLDDFGTGYSSLTYLKQIPLDILKIDKSFTDTILEENTNKNILSIIINLAKCCDLSTVAEGIEDREQLLWLNDKSCDIAQGFYMGKPMPEEKAFEIIEKNMYELIEN